MGKGEVEKMLTKIGYKTKKIPFIPMSGFKGDNLKEKSENMKWWKGWSVKIKKEKVSGDTLVEALEKVVKPPKRKLNKAFRMPVSGVYKINGVGDVITGRVEQGTINVGVNVKKLPKENMPRTGDVMAIDDLKVDPVPPKAAAEFTALVFVQDHPGKLSCGKQEKDKKTGKMVDKGGFTPSIHIRTAKAPCQMTAINWKMGKSTSNAKVEGVPYIEAGDQAE